MDRAELFRGAEMTQTDWATKENQTQEDFFMWHWSRSFISYNKSRIGVSTGQNCTKDLFRLFNEYLLRKRNILQPQRIRLVQTN